MLAGTWKHSAAVATTWDANAPVSQYLSSTHLSYHADPEIRFQLIRYSMLCEKTVFRHTTMHKPCHSIAYVPPSSLKPSLLHDPGEVNPDNCSRSGRPVNEHPVRRVKRDNDGLDQKLVWLESGNGDIARDDSVVSRLNGNSCPG
jgi:hypothetical protein